MNYLEEIKQSGKIKFGNREILTKISEIKSTSQKVKVKCECGNIVLVTYRNLAINNTKSCGHCSFFKFKKNNTSVFGKLTILNSIESIDGLNQKVKVKCGCGKQVTKKLYNVISGHTNSCGFCYESVKNWYDEIVPILKNVKYPIESGILFGLIKHNNIINSGRTKLDAECPLCHEKWNPIFKDIQRGVSLSCGCSYNKISTQQKEIGEFISKYCEIKYEEKINGRSYDLFIPSKNLLIEYHGLIWHSTLNSRKIDFNKYKNAVKLGYDMIVIYEDEWKNKRNIIERIIINKLENKKQSLRASKCQIKEVDSGLADDFYNKNHYIGQTKAKINLVLTYDDDIIACMSFKHPNRQSEYEYELTRMASNEFRVHGSWSKLFSYFIKKYSPKSIVSFSDNRLFGGNVYEKIGFSFDGNIKPDYYWVSSRNRHHKSKLRKPLKCKTTESELRLGQGFRKLWDLGKKRWVWRFDNLETYRKSGYYGGPLNEEL